MPGDQKTALAPARAMARARCKQCGAATEQQAATTCKQAQDVTGEYSCYATDALTDPEGFFLFETPKSEARYNAWFDARFAEEIARG